MFSFDLIYIIICLVGGILAGIASGMIGLGGGVIFIPVLLNILPLTGFTEPSPLTTIATSLFAGVFSSGSSSYFHSRSGNIHLKEGISLAGGAVAGSISASLFASGVDEVFLHYFIAAILVFVVIYLNFGKERIKLDVKRRNIFLPLTGIIMGAISALSGIGGGVLFLPVLAVVFAQNIKWAVGTSSFVVFITLLTGTVSYIAINGSGIVDYYTGILLAIGAITGARFGVLFLKKIEQSVIIKLFSLFLIINIIIIVF